MKPSWKFVVQQLQSRLPSHRVSVMNVGSITASDVAEAREVLRLGRVRKPKSTEGHTVRLVPRWVDGRTRAQRREALQNQDQVGLLPKGGAMSLQFVPDNGEAGSITVVFLPLEVGTDYRMGFKFGMSFCSPYDEYSVAIGYNRALERAKKCSPVMMDLLKIAQRGGLADLVSVLLMSIERPRWVGELATTTFVTRNLSTLNNLGSSIVYIFSGVRLNRILGAPDEDETGDDGK